MLLHLVEEHEIEEFDSHQVAHGTVTAALETSCSRLLPVKGAPDVGSVQYFVLLAFDREFLVRFHAYADMRFPNVFSHYVGFVQLIGTPSEAHKFDYQ